MTVHLRPSSSCNIWSRFASTATSARRPTPASSPSRPCPRALRELETLLGVTLVERTRRVVRFTAARRKGRGQGDPGPARVPKSWPSWPAPRASRCTASCAWASSRRSRRSCCRRCCRGCAAQWPSLKLFLREETSQAACEALHRGQLDCVLLALPFACGDVERAALFDDRAVRRLPPAARRRGGPSVDADAIDENRLLLLEDGHCLKDHALSACNRPELRAEAAMMGTSLHTLVQMVDNGLGLTFMPAMAIEAGILDGTRVDATPLRSDHGSRRIALIWRRSSPREERVPDARRSRCARSSASSFPTSRPPTRPDPSTAAAPREWRRVAPRRATRAY